jgi:hypothetical protein
LVVVHLNLVAVVNRPGVAGAVLQTAWSCAKSKDQGAGAGAGAGLDLMKYQII